MVLAQEEFVTIIMVTDSEGDPASGKSINYKIFDETRTSWDSGTMDEIIGTAIYYKVWTPDEDGYWVFEAYYSGSDFKFYDVKMYQVGKGVEDRIYDRLGNPVHLTISGDIADLITRTKGLNAIYDLINSVKTKTDTINWSDITTIDGIVDSIKVNTDTINWNDITVIDGIVDAIKSKTDNLPDDPADQSDIEGYLDTVESNIRGVDNDTLKTLSDQIDAIVGGIGTATLEKQNQIMDGTTDLSGGWIAGTDNLHELYSLLSTVDGKIDTIDGIVDSILVDTSAIDWSNVTDILADTNELQGDWTDGGRLDVILDTIKTKTDTIDWTYVADILLDTNELQGDWEDGGRLDVILDAIKAVTDNLPDSGALTTIDGKLDDIESKVNDVFDDVGDVIARLDNGTYGLGALNTDLDSIISTLGNATYGLSALETLVDEIESLLKDGTYGLSALKTEIDANEAKIDTLTSNLATHDTDIKADLGDFSGQSNLQSLLAVLGVPDVAGKSLYTCLITDRLDNATYGLSAIETLVDDLETRLTATRAGYLDELDFDLDARLGSPAGASISADILSLYNLLTNATYGLSALETLVDDLETRLTAVRAGYLDELDFDLQGALTTIDTNVDDIENMLKASPSTDSILFKSGGSTCPASKSIWDALGDGTVSLNDIFTAIGGGVTGSVSDVGPTTTDFDTDLSEASDDHYNNLVIVFTSGVLTGQSRRIKDYDGTSKNIITYEAFTEAPADGDDFYIAVEEYSVDEDIKDLLEDGTYGLSALDTDLGTLLTRLSATRAGYLDELDFDLDARLGSPAGASISADIAAVKSVVDDILTDTGVIDWTDITSILTALGSEFDGTPDLYDVLVTGYDSSAISDDPDGSILERLEDLLVDTTAILTDTGELQSDWTDGGRLDLILDAIKTVTDNLPDSGALTTIDTNIDDIEADTNEIQQSLTDGGFTNNLIDSIISKVDVIDGYHDVPAQDSADNVVMSDVIGNKTDTTGGDSIIALIKLVDSIVDAIKTSTDTIDWSDVTDILADTNELQTDWANGGRLDLLIDGIKERTDNLPDDPADQSDLESYISTRFGSEIDGTPDLYDLIVTGYDSSGIVENVDGSILERFENIKEELADGTYGLSALQTLIDGLNDLAQSDILDDATPFSGADIGTILSEIQDGTYGLEAIKDLIVALNDLAQSDILDDATPFSGADIADILADTNEIQTDLADGGRLDLLIDAIKAKTDTIVWSDITTIDGIVDDILADTNELQTDWTDGGRLDIILDAIKAKTDTITGGGDATEAKQDTIIGYVDDLESRLTATRAGYLDELDFDLQGTLGTIDTNVDDIETDTNELQTDLTDGGRLDLIFDAIKDKTDNLPSDPADASDIADDFDRHVVHIDFWGDADNVISITGGSTDINLPNVIIPTLPTGATIWKVILLFKCAIIKDTSGSDNAINGASAIRIKKSTGSWGVDDIVAYDIKDNSWAVDVSEATERGGDAFVGNMNEDDLSGEVDEAATYNLRFEDIQADGGNLQLHDVAVGLRIYIY